MLKKMRIVKAGVADRKVAMFFCCALSVRRFRNCPRSNVKCSPMMLPSADVARFAGKSHHHRINRDYDCWPQNSEPLVKAYALLSLPGGLLETTSFTRNDH